MDMTLSLYNFHLDNLRQHNQAKAKENLLMIAKDVPNTMFKIFYLTQRENYKNELFLVIVELRKAAF